LIGKRLALLIVLAPLAAVAGGCGGSGSEGTAGPTGTTVTVTPPTTTLTVFRVRDGELQAETAHVPQTRAVAAATLKALGLTAPVTITNGTATVGLDSASDEQIAEIVYTLTQFESVQRVNVAGRTGLTRGDVASFVPPILIETPAKGAEVPRVFTVSGTASVFEATLVLELRRGGVLVKQTVTASEGAPGRGSFEATMRAPSAGDATVAAYSPSAADGSAQHEQDVVVTIAP
jgi:hypothetical protein